MAKFGAISRRELIQGLRSLGFTGPLHGTRHEVMVRGTTKVILPNPHSGDISVGLLSRILRTSGISRAEWDRAD